MPLPSLARVCRLDSVYLLFLKIMRKIVFILSVFAMSHVNAQKESNPLLQDWKGPNNGAPAFNEYKVSHFKPARESAMKEDLAELDAIANNKQTPTFENTILALEKSGKKLSRVLAVYYVFSSNINTPDFEAVQTEM